MKILFLLAHQDDEIVYINRIKLEIVQRSEVSVVYLTNGQGKGSESLIRNEESLRCLRSVGLSDEKVHFLGEKFGFPDGKLVFHLSKSLQVLLEWGGQNEFDKIYTLAWEGGHPDHDALHLISLAFARKKKCLNYVYEAALYNGFRCPPKLFRMLRPIRRRVDFEIRTFSLSEAITWFLKIRFFTSQKVTWLGLGPDFFYRVILYRQELFQKADLQMALSRPHEGPLLYETHGRMSFEKFQEAVGSFRNELTQ